MGKAKKKIDPRYATDIKLTAEERAPIQELFILFDKKDNGKMPTKYFPDILRALHMNPSNAQIKQHYRNCDPERKGFIIFDQLVKLIMAQKKVRLTEEQIRDAFRVFDDTGKGVIPADVLRNCLISYGEVLSQEEANCLIAKADPRHTGKIKYEDFVTNMLKEDGLI